jgi:hypothetical protein
MEIIVYKSDTNGSSNGNDRSSSSSSSSSSSASTNIITSRSPLSSLQIYIVEPSKKHNNAIIATIHGLESYTSYDYEMHITGQRVGKGKFRTAPSAPASLLLLSSSSSLSSSSLSRQQPQPPPPPPPPPNNGNINNNNGNNNNGGGKKGYKFNYVLASCMNYRKYKNQIVWKEGIIKDAFNNTFPDFAILAGDTIYLDDSAKSIDIISSKDGVQFDRFWYRNQEQRSEKHFAYFISNTPIYSTW